MKSGCYFGSEQGTRLLLSRAAGYYCPGFQSPAQGKPGHHRTARLALVRLFDGILARPVMLLCTNPYLSGNCRCSFHAMAGSASEHLCEIKRCKPQSRGEFLVSISGIGPGGIWGAGSNPYAACCTPSLFQPP